MHIFTSSLKSGQDRVKAACESLGQFFPEPMSHAVILGMALPGAVRQLDDRLCGGRLRGYAMCLNHWLPFLPVPVILLNAEWFADGEKLKLRYAYDVAAGYHPDCGCPFKYIMAHELAHFMYVRMKPGDRKKWESAFEPGRPSGYSTTAEEGFCEALAGSVSGLEGLHFEQAAKLAEPYRQVLRRPI